MEPTVKATKRRRSAPNPTNRRTPVPSHREGTKTQRRMPKNARNLEASATQ